MKQPKDDAETLMSAVLPLAEEMLKRYGEFYPYAGYMQPDGSIVHMGSRDPDDEFPKSADLVDLLRHSLIDKARNRECDVIAMVLNVAVQLPGEDHKSDAIQLHIEHASGYSVDVFIPYSISDDVVVYGETMVQQGGAEVFD
jgi:hypothetical protein